MTRLRVGSRGSELALTQTRWVCDRLREAHLGIEIEEVIIRTHGDAATDQPFDAAWPVGSFVSALEMALVNGEIDFAVHSYKDLPSESPEGLVIAAVPQREVAHDVMVVREPVTLNDLPRRFRIGTSSPRRSAQLRRLGEVELVPIRGNVPTRLGKVTSGEVDAVVLAAAGLRRLGIEPEHVVPLPTDRFVPSPAQGALAIQSRAGDEAERLLDALNHAPSRCAVEAERAFLARVEAGCQTPLGALATLADETITLRAQLFSDDGERLVKGKATGSDPLDVGDRLGKRLVAELNG
jgi:hydroxymethylbilane synthase